MTNPTKLCLAVAMLVTSVGSSGATARKDVGAPLVHEKVVVDLVGHATWVEGETSEVGDSSGVAAVGESLTLWYGAGDLLDDGRPDPFFQNNFTGHPSLPPKDVPGLALYVWRADVRVVEAGSEAVTLEVTWTRYHSDRPGHPASEAGDTRKFTLAQKSRHVLDFIDLPWSTCYRNFSMSIRVDVQEDEAFATSKMAYDLWLVQGNGEAARRLGRLQLRGGQGEDLKSEFSPVLFPLPGAKWGDGRLVDCVMQMAIDVQGRRRANGTVDVRLDARRHLSIAARGDTPVGGIGDFGHKTFSVTPGETVALALPDTQGGIFVFPDEAVRRGTRRIDHGAIPEQGNTDVPGLILTKDVIGVRNPQFFADKPMSLLLSVTVDR